MEFFHGIGNRRTTGGAPWESPDDLLGLLSINADTKNLFIYVYYFMHYKSFLYHYFLILQYRRQDISRILVVEIASLLWNKATQCGRRFGRRHILNDIFIYGHSLIARLMGPTWGPSGADRTQVGHMWATWTLLSGLVPVKDGVSITSWTQQQMPNVFVWYKKKTQNCNTICHIMLDETTAACLKESLSTIWRFCHWPPHENHKCNLAHQTRNFNTPQYINCKCSP